MRSPPNIGARGTEMAVRYALEAAKYQNAPGLSPDTKRKLDHAAQRDHAPRADHAGRRASSCRTSRRGSARLRQGQGHADGKPINGSDIEAAMGDEPQSGRAQGDVDQLERQCRRADARRLCQDGRHRQSRAPTNSAITDTGAMWRSGYDMPPDEFAKLTDRLWKRGQAALPRAPHLCPLQAQREIRRCGPAEDRPDPRRPARQHVGAGMGQHLRRRRAGRCRRCRLRHRRAAQGQEL